MSKGYIPYKSGTLLIPSGPADKKHLFVILNNACVDKKHLLVGISSIPEGKFFDDTCILSANDHPFIKHDSYVIYKFADIRPAARINHFVESKYFLPKEDMSIELTDMIGEGLMASPFSKNFCKDYLEKLL